MPVWAILFATSLRCVWRRWRFGRMAPFKPVSQAPALVIAPHPDDETFGCGALISLKRSMGVPVRVIVLTGGEAVAIQSRETAETVIQARKQQTLAACQHLGVAPAEVRWLDLPDGKLPQFGQPGFEAAIKRLAKEVEDFFPGEIYCPHPLDYHPDHIAASAMAREILPILPKPCRVMHYGIWIWYHARTGLTHRLVIKHAWRLDGRSVKSKKMAAYAAYLNAPKSASGIPYCGHLPWGFLWNFRRTSELFFDDSQPV